MKQPQKNRSTLEFIQFKIILVGGSKYFLFSPLFGEDFQFDKHSFQRGWFNHQPDNLESHDTLRSSKRSVKSVSVCAGAFAQISARSIKGALRMKAGGATIPK